LLEAAYPLPPSSSLGAPAWLNFDRFDVIAKAPGNVDDKIRAAVKGDGAKEKVGVPQSTDPSIEQLMLRALLQERFKLVLHEETREQPVYALTLRGRADRSVRSLRDPPSIAVWPSAARLKRLVA
jgi:uncharacterized protein (TIGR03435 family)